MHGQRFGFEIVQAPWRVFPRPLAASILYDITRVNPAIGDSRQHRGFRRVDAQASNWIGATMARLSRYKPPSSGRGTSSMVMQS